MAFEEVPLLFTASSMLCGVAGFKGQSHRAKKKVGVYFVPQLLAFAAEIQKRIDLFAFLLVGWGACLPPVAKGIGIAKTSKRKPEFYTTTKK